MYFTWGNLFMCKSELDLNIFRHTYQVNNYGATAYRFGDGQLIELDVFDPHFWTHLTVTGAKNLEWWD